MPMSLSGWAPPWPQPGGASGILLTQAGCSRSWNWPTGLRNLPITTTSESTTTIESGGADTTEVGAETGEDGATTTAPEE